MRVLILLVACVAAASASTLHFQQKDAALDDEWASYKTAFGKKYPTPQHEAVRRIIWEQNMRNIQKHNFEADLGKHSYRIGMNHFGDLTKDEFRRQVLCVGMNTTRSGSLFLSPSNVKLPGTVDWRDKGYVTPVKNQGGCGSCWSFSSTGSLEGQHFKKTGKLVSLSEQNLVDCTTSYGNRGCGGGWMDNAFKYIKANGGIDTEASYPYEAENRPCRFNPATVGATVTGYVATQAYNETALQIAVATVGPVSVAIDASHHGFQYYKTGVYIDPKCTSSLDHAVLVVGYGTTSEGTDYWLVKNSWGPNWGSKGYIKMARNRNNQCGIASHARYPLV